MKNTFPDLRKHQAHIEASGKAVAISTKLGELRKEHAQIVARLGSREAKGPAHDLESILAGKELSAGDAAERERERSLAKQIEVLELGARQTYDKLEAAAAVAVTDRVTEYARCILPIVEKLQSAGEEFLQAVQAMEQARSDYLTSTNHRDPLGIGNFGLAFGTDGAPETARWLAEWARNHALALEGLRRRAAFQ